MPSRIAVHTVGPRCARANWTSSRFNAGRMACVFDWKTDGWSEQRRTGHRGPCRYRFSRCAWSTDGFKWSDRPTMSPTRPMLRLPNWRSVHANGISIATSVGITAGVAGLLDALGIDRAVIVGHDTQDGRHRAHAGAPPHRRQRSLDAAGARTPSQSTVNWNRLRYAAGLRPTRSRNKREKELASL